MEKKKIRLLIVDDHPSVVLGIKAALAGNNLIEVIGDARDGEAAIRKAKKLMPDVVLLDVSMPKKSGLDVMKELLPKMLSTKFLVHTMHDNNELLYEFKRAGASGYLLKNSTPQKVRTAILAVSKRRHVFASIKSDSGRSRLKHPKILGQSWPLANSMAPLEAIRLKFDFTGKEMEVVKLILKGMDMHQVANQLELAYNTITSHFKHVYKKLGVHTRAKAITKLMGVEADGSLPT